MNTQTHLLISASLLAKPDHPRRNLAMFFGAILPDASIYALVVWAKLNAIPERQIWRLYYWQEPWQTYGALLNSIPIYLFGLLCCVVTMRLVQVTPSGLLGTKTERHDHSVTAFAVLFISCLVHIAFDFPVHVDDAHRHFWPISDWKFVSPISYWNSNHHGDVVQVIENIAALLMIGLLFRRFKQIWVRCLLALGAMSYVAVPLYWAMSLSN